MNKNIVFRIFSTVLITVALISVHRVTPAHAATILFVTAEGMGDCSNWQMACQLQTALTTASSGDEIWVKMGVYKPTDTLDRSISFQLKEDVSVFGGFNGTETNREQRDYYFNITILSGDLLGNDDPYILPPYHTEDNSYHVVIGANGAALDGLTVRGGHGDIGSGINNASSDAMYTNLRVERNYAILQGAGFLNDHGNPKIINVLFTHNQTGNGGRGGGMATLNGNPLLKDVHFLSNDADYGAGIYNSNGSPILLRVRFTGNGAYVSGGGMYNEGGNPVLLNVDFYSNGGMIDGGGGGLYNASGSPELTNVSFHSNMAATDGGGFSSITGDPKFINVTFYQNKAMHSGGGLSVLDGNASLVNVSFTMNNARQRGGGIHNEKGKLQIHNAILWGDTADIEENEVFSNTSTVDIQDSIIMGDCPSNISCINLITKDPMLGGIGEYGGFPPSIPLTFGSPAIDAGNDSFCPPADQRGITRPQGTHCDIGAYEYREPIFTDTPTILWAVDFIERIYINGISTGCNEIPLKFCPEMSVSRATMAIFLLRSIHGSEYNPPPATGAVFVDVPTTYWAAAWIEQLAAEGITSGCGNGIFCPEAPVTRDQIAVFLLRAKYGADFSPPPAVGRFWDIPVDYWAAPWIEELYVETITNGCDNVNYCPTTAVNRAQMAVFLVRAFSLP